MTALDDPLSVHVLSPELADMKASLLFWMLCQWDRAAMQHVLTTAHLSTQELNTSGEWCN